MPPQDSMQQPYQLNRVLYYYILLPWSTTQAFAPDQRKLGPRPRACTVPAGAAQLIFSPPSSTRDYCPAPADDQDDTRDLDLGQDACARALVMR